MEDRVTESLEAQYKSLLVVSKKLGLNLSQQEIFAHAVRLEAANIIARSNFETCEMYV
jgi:hypothetical protein